MSRRSGALDGLVTCAGLGGATGRPASLVVSVDDFGTVDGGTDALRRPDDWPARGSV